MIAPDRIAAVLLAGGGSRRFGSEDKLLAELDGKPLARHAANRLAEIGFGKLIAVTTPGLARLFPEFETVINARPEEGQSRSLRLGVEASGDADAALIALADMPFVSAAHLRALLAAHDELTASSLDGTAMPPALFNRSMFPSLKALQGDSGARSLLAGANLVQASPAELADIDTRDDLSRASRSTPARASRRSSPRRPAA